MSKLQDAIDLYITQNGDFAESLKWHLSYGVVVSMPDCFMLGFFCDKSEPREPKDLAESDCIFVTLCIGNMRTAGMQIVQIVPFIAYEREFKGDRRVRVKNFKDFYKKLK